MIREICPQKALDPPAPSDLPLILSLHWMQNSVVVIRISYGEEYYPHSKKFSDARICNGAKTRLRLAFCVAMRLGCLTCRAAHQMLAEKATAATLLAIELSEVDAPDAS